MCRRSRAHGCCVIFSFKYPATTSLYTLSLHDALPICALDQLRLARPLDLLQLRPRLGDEASARGATCAGLALRRLKKVDRKSTRLNSSHTVISYAVFCLKKKRVTPISLVSGAHRQTNP